MPSVYIIQGLQGVKVGQSLNPPTRLYALRQATPNKLEMIWSADFGDAAIAIEAGTKKILKPWNIRGEWFRTSPLMVGLAIEAARDQNERIVSFIDRMAALIGLSVQDEIAAEDAIERGFPDIYPRIAPLDPGIWTDWRGKSHPLPHRKFTRVMVKGCPETIYGCPIKPTRIRLHEEMKAKREGRKLRLKRSA